jgi:hypothetical protein
MARSRVMMSRCMPMRDMSLCIASCASGPAALPRESRSASVAMRESSSSLPSPLPSIARSRSDRPFT